MSRLFLILGSLSAFLGVALGAFGAHALKGRLSHDMLEIFETGVRYQVYHAFGLLTVAFVLSQWETANVSLSGWCFVGGTVLFSGSLYLLAVTGTRWLGIITPLGGMLFLAGWLWLAWGLWRTAQN